MNQFLAVVIETVVDQPFVPAKPEVIEVRHPTTNEILVPAEAAVPEVPLVTHEEVMRSFVEQNSETVIKNLESTNQIGQRIEYYHIQYNGPTFQATLHPVSLKSGPRATAPAREIAEIQANGQDVGSAVVEV